MTPGDTYKAIRINIPKGLINSIPDLGDQDRYARDKWLQPEDHHRLAHSSVQDEFLFMLSKDGRFFARHLGTGKTLQQPWKKKRDGSPWIPKTHRAFRGLVKARIKSKSFKSLNFETNAGAENNGEQQ